MLGSVHTTPDEASTALYSTLSTLHGTCYIPSTYIHTTYHIGHNYLLPPTPASHHDGIGPTLLRAASTLAAVLPCPPALAVAMLTSSPTISASASPSTAFHASAHRSYHAASRRPSAPSTAHSPRFAVSSAAARRLDAPPTPTPTPRPAFTATLPSPPIATTTTTAPEPPSCKRAYTDAGTQYTPDGLPPTHRPSPTPALTHGTPTDSLTAPAIAPSPRGHASASPVATEPPVPSEPHVRVDAQPASPAQHATTAQPHTRRTPKQKARSPPEPEPEPAYEQPALQRAASTVLQVAASPAKRARPEDDRTVQMMPLQYETCDVKHLGVLISDMLMELVRLNDGYPLRDGTLTRFHSRYGSYFHFHFHFHFYYRFSIGYPEHVLTGCS